MADQLIMPRLGNTVETCLITEWLKTEGDTVEEGEAVCSVETDKAAVEVESTFSGTVLKILFEEGDEVPVLTPIVLIGEPGEDISLFDQSGEPQEHKSSNRENQVETSVSPESGAGSFSSSMAVPEQTVGKQAEKSAGISPRAKNLASSEGIPFSGLKGTGPGGRVVERDVAEVLTGLAPATPAAIEKLAASGGTRPESGTGPGGRVTAADIGKKDLPEEPPVSPDIQSVKTTEVPLKGVRKIISAQMLKSISTTAQLTLHTSADASALMALRSRFKERGSELGLDAVSVNDLVMFAVVKTLKDYPEMNAHFLGDRIVQYGNINLGIAVDTERGLLVPVIKNADRFSLKEFAGSTRAVYGRIKENSILPDELSGGTFTVTNLGGLGIERFTPILNVPEVAILGVCTIEPKAVYGEDGAVKHVPHIGLSLTFNHQAADGAPAARFLKSLCGNIADIDLLLAL